MLDINLIKENPEKVKQGIKKKGYDAKIIDELLQEDKKWRQIIKQAQLLREERNKIIHQTKKKYSSKIISQARKIIKKETEKETREVDFAKVIKAAIKLLKVESDPKKIETLWLQIPNLPADDVPDGKDESENVEVKKWGKLKKFSFKPKDYQQLGESLDLIDTKTASKVSGTRFGYLKNEAVQLEFALVQLALEILVKESFIPIAPPVLINRKITEGLGYWQHGGNEDYFYIGAPHDFYLVGTSEHSLIPMHMDKIMEVKNLPRRYVSFSTCFRREAGTYGKDTKGIFRVHQFDKIEMVSFIKPQPKADQKEHDYLLSLEEKLVQALEIPYQITQMCTGDLGHPVARKYDLNCWFPTEKRYRETHSTSTCP